MKDKIFDKSIVRGISVTVPKERLMIKDLKFDGVNMEETMQLTGIQELRRAPANMTATDYCINSAERLFEALEFNPAQIDGVVFATPISDYLTPGSGYVVQERLNLSSNCIIVDINQACAGYVNGLFQASMLVQSGYCKNVLLCAGDTAASIHPKDKSMQVLLGDAGAAAIVSCGDDDNGDDGSVKSAFSFYNEGQNFRAVYTPAGGRRIPIEHGATDVEKTDEQGNVRTLENAHMDGLEVMAFALTAAPKTIKNLFDVMGWTKEDVKIYSLHQANQTIINALIKKLRIPADKVPISLTYYGNTAAASTPLNLCLKNPDAYGGDEMNKVILCGFGNGLACASAAMNLSRTYFSEVYEL